MVAERNYLALFVAESTDQLERLGSELVELEAAREAVPADLWDSIFRRVHSIKGGAATLELSLLVGVAHAAEELIARQRSQPLGRDVVDLLLEACDLLSKLLRQALTPSAASEHASALAADRQAAPIAEADVEGVVARLAKMSAGLHAKDPRIPIQAVDERAATALGADGSIVPPPPEVPRYTLRIQLGARCAAPGARAMIVQRKLGAVGTLLSQDPAPAQQAQSRTPLVIHARVASTVDPETIRQSCLKLPEVESVELRAGLGDPSEAVPAQAAPTLAPDSTPPTPASDSAPPPAFAGFLKGSEPTPEATVRVRAAALDQLLDAAGEVLGGVLRLRESARSLPETHAPAFEAEIDRLRRMVRELHGKVVSARLTPFSTLTERLPRAVRDLSRRLGKEVELEVRGADVELDRAIIDAMGNPLTHLVRNAIDHGLESPEERASAGKPALGKLSLRARRERDRVMVDVIDDGRGVDVAAVRRKAVESGAITADAAAALSDAQALELAFLPGLSTRDAATEVSGRGVGLDAVMRAVETLGGQLSASSVVGHGSTFTLELPRSVAMANLLLIQVGGELFGIPLVRVLVTIESDLSARGGEGFASRSVVVAGEWVRSYPLAQLFGLPSLAPPGPRPFVVLDVDKTTFALAVDRLVGQEEAVVRPLFAPLDRMPGLAGTCVLASGRPLLVLDPRGLAELAGVPGIEKSVLHKKGAA